MALLGHYITVVHHYTDGQQYNSLKEVAVDKTNCYNKIHHCKSICIGERVSFSQFPHKPMEKSDGRGLEVITLDSLSSLVSSLLTIGKLEIFARHCV